MNYWLNDLRLLAALAVINVHVVYSISTVLMPETGDLNWWIANLYSAFSLWGVPAFVMISGAILLSPNKTYSSVNRFYSKRAGKLGIPILFWTGFYILFTMLKNDYKGVEYGVGEIFEDLLSGQPYGHMWYLYMAIGLYLFTPYLRKIVMHSSRGEVKFLTVLLLSISLLGELTQSISPQNTALFIQMFPSYLGYFFVGHLILTSRKEIGNPLLIVVILLSGTATAVGRYAQYRWGVDYNAYSNFSVSIMILSIAIVLLIRNNYRTFGVSYEKRVFFAGFSLGAYLMNPAFIAILKKYDYLGTDLSSYLFLKIPLFTLAVTAVSLLTAYIFSRVKYLNKTV
jgi:surface polysaccharide O-acyltransferase-like enzyme